MRINRPNRYKTAGLGQWGTTEGVIYENWEEKPFNTQDIIGKDTVSVFGLDFGYTNDPTALFCGVLNPVEKVLYVFDELYAKGLSNRRIYDQIVKLGYGKELIIADSAEPKSIDELRSYGLRIKPAVKGAGSVNAGIQWIQDLKIIVHPRCVNFITEINNYTWATSRLGQAVNKPNDDFNHLMDAMRYGLQNHIQRKRWIY